MYTSLPIRPHIRQVRRSGTCTHKNTSTCTLPCLQDRTYGRYFGQGRVHTQTHTYMYTALPTRLHIQQVRQSGKCTHTHTQTHMYTTLPTGPHTWQGHAHTQTHKYMYSSLPIRTHIRQVRRSGTCTHTHQGHSHRCGRCGHGRTTFCVKKKKKKKKKVKGHARSPIYPRVSQDQDRAWLVPKRSLATYHFSHFSRCILSSRHGPSVRVRL